MPQLPVDKTFFTFAGGINTEVSPLTFPEGVSLDEQNFEFLINGTRKRRNGLRKESGHGSFDPAGKSYWVAGQAFGSYRWTNVGGNPDRTFVVVQMGAALLFGEDGEDISGSFRTDLIDLSDLCTTAVEADAYSYPLDFSSGRGFLFVAGRYIEPFYVSYDEATDSLTAHRIEIYVRDFRGVEDGIDLRANPTTLTDDHKYNLVNRGFPSTLITAFFTSLGKYPAKNQVYYRGLRRQTISGYSELDGTQEFNAAKLEAEAFGDSSAPQGALILSPFNTGLARLASGSLNNIASFTFSVVSSTFWLVTVTTSAAHSLSPGDTFTVTNSSFSYNTTSSTQATGSLNGTFVVNTAPSGTQVTFYLPRPSGWSSWVDQYITKGQIGTDIVIRTDAYLTNERPQSVAFFAGRVWWAGTAHPEINDTLYFSQIAYNDKQFGRCYQEADPTSDFINALTPSDGGTIIVPNLGTVYRMVPMENSLIIFAQNGVWEVGPNVNRGFFSADGYQIRKISDVEVTGQKGVCKMDSTVLFTSVRGVYVLAPDPNSGQVNAQSLTETTIQSLWNDIPDDRKGSVQAEYDDSKKRVYILYANSSTIDKYAYNASLNLDVRLGAWTRYTYPYNQISSFYRIQGIYASGFGDASDSYKKMKFFVVGLKSGKSRMQVLDFGTDTTQDWTNTEQDAFVITGYDNLGDFSRHRQAPVIHVFMERTEDGFNPGSGDDELVPRNSSSCWMQARWDWADASTAGKWGTEQQVYRHVRYYQPTGPSDTFNSGYPVIVTRNKLRGRGRCLHLRFRAGAGSRCHILGWAIEYRGERSQ